jgi:ADP-ribosyl-[dinitrogen reductase] hydrolase
MENKIFGMFIGASLGDALGAPHEFKWQTDIYTGELIYPLSSKVGSYYDRKLFTGVIGQITDDTEMALLITRGLLKNDIYDRDFMIAEYMEWANYNIYPFLGYNIRSLFKGIKTRRGYDNRIKKQGTYEIDKLTQSNGCLMRCYPLVFETEEIQITDCKLTNLSPLCIEVNLIYLSILKHILLKKKSITLNFKTRIVRDVYLDAVNKKHRNVTGKTKGWILHAFWCAIYAWKHYKSYKDGIDWVITLGGDTDTNASIAGALLGAKYGFDRIYKESSNNVDILLNANPDLGNFPRKCKYRVSDIKELVEKFTKKYT